MSQLFSGRNSVDHLLRSTQQHHIFLSGMADRKASFLIAAASVMLTLIFGRLSNGGEIPLALIILAGFSLVATLLAILCIMPRNQVSPKKDDEINLLFFGGFSHLTKQEYCERMACLFEDDAKIYRAISEEIYTLGQLLQNTKFKYLNWAYRVFLIGIISTAIVISIELASG